MRASTHLATILALFLIAISIPSAANAQPVRCELYATDIERIPCYYARAAYYAHAAHAAGPVYYHRHKSWKRHAVSRHSHAKYYQR